MTITPANALHGHTDETTAFVVEDYPYGFRLRTQIRYWIETTKHGDRHCAQTMNPKTGRWNKPKKSTYSAVMCLWVDGNDDDHVKPASISAYDDPNRDGTREWWATFLAAMDGHLSDMQKDRIAEIRGMAEAMKDVTFSVHEGRMTDEDRREQAKIQGVIAHRAEHATGEIRGTL